MPLLPLKVLQTKKIPKLVIIFIFELASKSSKEFGGVSWEVSICLQKTLKLLIFLLPKWIQGVHKVGHKLNLSLPILWWYIESPFVPMTHLEACSVFITSILKVGRTIGITTIWHNKMFILALLLGWILNLSNTSMVLNLIFLPLSSPVTYNPLQWIWCFK